eukprot:2682492-Heterocapsa_arctica.AAC.1
MANCRGDLGAAEAGDWRRCQHELTKQVEDVRSRIGYDTPLRSDNCGWKSAIQRGPVPKAEAK